MVRGLPDHLRHTVISRREIALELQQSMWYYTASVIVPANSSATFDLYTVPAGERLVVEFFHPSTESKRFRGWADLQDYDGATAYRFVGVNLFGEAAKLIRYPVTAGHTLRLALTNYDKWRGRTSYVVVQGYTEPV